MQVLFIHSSDELYGSDRVLLSILSGLDRKRFEPLVVLPMDTPGSGQLTQVLADEGIEVLRMNIAVLRRRFLSPLRLPGFAWRTLTSTFGLARLISRRSVDAVHSNTTAVVSGALAARLRRRPHVWQVLEIIIQPRWMWRSLAWLVPRLSRIVVAASGPTLEHLVAGDRRNADRGRVIHHAIDTGPFLGAAGSGCVFRQELGVAPGQVLVGVVGRVSAWKGQDEFIRAAERVHRTRPDARFVVVGGTGYGEEGLLEGLREQAATAGLAEVLRFTGERDDIPAVMDALDVFVLPSTRPDPFPGVVLEAMAAARPVIAYAHGGPVEAVQDGLTGILVKPGDPSALADAVIGLVDDRGLREVIGAAGRARVEDRFSREEFRRAWAEVYEDLRRHGSA